MTTRIEIAFEEQPATTVKNYTTPPSANTNVRYQNKPSLLWLSKEDNTSIAVLSSKTPLHNNRRPTKIMVVSSLANPRRFSTRANYNSVKNNDTILTKSPKTLHFVGFHTARRIVTWWKSSQLAVRGTEIPEVVLRCQRKLRPELYFCVDQPFRDREFVCQNQRTSAHQKQQIP